MTIEQASKILGMSPTHHDGDRFQWRRGNAQKYNGTSSGAIEFRVVDGRIVDVPDGGIFSPAAQAKIDAEWLRKRQQADAELRLENARLAEEARIAAEARRMQEEKDQEQRTKEIAAEMEAAKTAVVICTDKTTCNKVFALAQIYVQQNSDQKIQVATDTIIETYNPTEGGKAGMTVIKIPRAGTTEVVQIKPSCNEEKHYEGVCRLKRTAIYRGFKPFIERSLSR